MIKELQHEVKNWMNVCKYYKIFFPAVYLQLPGYDEALSKADCLCKKIVQLTLNQDHL